MSPGLRYMRLPPIYNLTQTLDTFIVCTVCRGHGVVYKKREGMPTWAWPLVPCPECHGTKEMKSRTTEEQEGIKAAKK